nr:TadE/TadG family type IV pilus assembly protein [Parapontixanthobacter aurantiacus]
MAMRGLLSLFRDERGTTVVEFALIVIPVCIVMIGGMEVAYQSYVRTVMQGALDTVARTATVEAPVIAAAGDSTEERIAERVRSHAGTVAVDAEITIVQRSYLDFGGVERLEKLVTDVNGNGQFDEDDNDCWEDENGSGTFDERGRLGRGAGDDVVFYTASIRMPRLFPVAAFDLLSPTIAMSVETAVRNQPFGDRPPPAILCGSGDAFVG